MLSVSAGSALANLGLWMVVVVFALPIVFVGLALWVLVSARQAARAPLPAAAAAVSRSDALRRSFALGEITYEEYERLLTARS